MSVADTHAQSTVHPHAHEAGAPVDVHSVDELLDLDADQLAELYRGARVPRLAELSGDLRGRMLAIPSLTRMSPVARLLRAFAASARFPWRGKSFTPHGETDGEGVNRVLSDRLKLFTFSTTVGRSRAGDFDAVQLDYDRPGNPFLIRTVKDEVRELRPGLYLGTAWLVLGGKPRLALYFGLQRQAARN